MTINSNRFLAKNGLDNNSKTITNVADPVNAQDAATRAYVLANAGGSISLTDDTTTNSTHYLSLTTSTSGTVNSLKVSSSKLAFNPSTGVLRSTVFQTEASVTTHATQGLYLEWNKSGGGGESYILNQKGAGTGGIVFGEISTANVITERMRIDTSGNVGIGGTPVASQGILQAFGTSAGAAIGVARFVNTSATANSAVALSLDPGNNGVSVRDAQIRAINNGSNQIDLTFWTSNAATPTEKMRIDYNGNVGIGGTPAATSGTLQVIGNYGAPSNAFAGTSVAAIRLNSTGSWSEPRIDFAEGTMSPIGFIAGKNIANGGGNLMFYTRDTSSTSSVLTLRFQVNENGTYTTSFSRAGGLSTSWGTTNGQFTGAFSALMGTSSSATWLLSGTSGSTFRCGIQALDSDGQLRIYSNGNYIAMNGASMWGTLYGAATTLHTTRSTWSTNGTISAVVGQLAWKNFGNAHTIFDASNGTSPDGTAVNSSNSAVAWTASYPTLMGWNGSQTYGVRVDSARVADSATTAANYLPLAGGIMSGSIQMAPGGTTRGYYYADSAGIGMLNSSGGWANRVDYGTSNFYCMGDMTAAGSITASTYYTGWYRSTGNAGWYSETYGGGIYMTDAAYVRTYNNKSFVAHSYVEVANNYGTVSGAQTINVLNGSMVSMTLNGATTYTFSGAPVSGNAASFTLELTNGGAYTVTWPSGTKWSGGVAPILTASGTDILSFFTRDGGTTWRGVMVSKDSR